MSVGYDMQPAEMYKLVARQNDDWGIQGYKIPTKYFDHVKSKKEKEQVDKLKQKVIY